jgi:hypothetical protein
MALLVEPSVAVPGARGNEVPMASVVHALSNLTRPSASQVNGARTELGARTKLDP